MKEPWELYPNIWKTASAFFQWLRGQLRRNWSHYPPKIEWKKAQMIKPPAGFKGRAKTVGTCHYCKDYFAASNLEVDHVVEAGSCNSWETASQFMYNLLDCNDNWVLSCKPCHKVKSLAERNGTSFEEARIEKEVIAIMKDKRRIKEMLELHGIIGATNVKKRREAITKIVKELHEISD